MATTSLAPRGNGGRRALSLWGEDPFEALHDDIDRLFGRYFGGTRMPSLLGPEVGSLAFSQNFAQMDISESEDAIDITVDVPGMEVKDIDVTLADNILTIKGTRKTEAEEKKDDYFRVERSYGSFQRRVELPSEVNENKIDASVKKGVLRLHLPKTERAKAHEKKIAIKAS